MKYEHLPGILSFSLATYIFHLLRAGVVSIGGINSVGRKKIYQLQTGLTAKKRRIAPCWPTRCRLESFVSHKCDKYRHPIDRAPAQRSPGAQRAKGDFGGMSMLIDRLNLG